MIEWLNDWLNDWMLDWMIENLIEWLNDWMIEWLNDWMLWEERGPAWGERLIRGPRSLDNREYLKLHITIICLIFAMSWMIEWFFICFKSVLWVYSYLFSRHVKGIFHARQVWQMKGVCPVEIFSCSARCV